MGLIRTIIILFLVYYIFKFVARIVLPLLLNSFIQKKQAEFQKHFQQQQQHSYKKEGEINIDYVPPKGKSKADDLGGEYVDYEEVK